MVLGMFSPRLLDSQSPRFTGIGQTFDGGITVYRYDLEERMLTKAWVG